MDANAQPFYMVGDSVWMLTTNLTEAEAAQYFQQRASEGFNAALIDAVIQADFGGPNDRNGNAPFTANLPGTGSFDVTKPNPAYWQHLDKVINLAAQNGIEVVLNVFDTYSAFLTANPTANLRAYGQFLGQRYADADNIIWMLGNDYAESSSVDGDMTAVIQGIRQFDARHVMTLEGWYTLAAPQTSFNNPALRQYLTLDGVYWYPGNFGEGPYRTEYLSEYNRPDFGPTFNIETAYETGPVSNGTANGITTDPAGIRQQDYEFLLDGATGDLYGSITVWKFDQQWQQQLTSEGSLEMTHFVNLQRSLPWFTLVPDQNGAVFQGVGSPAIYCGAYAPDGTLALAYKPATGGTTSQSFTVHMNAFSGPVTAQWYDPTNGTYTPIGSGLANSGSRTFTSPGANSAGDNDWLLVLKAARAAVVGRYVFYNNSAFDGGDPAAGPADDGAIAGDKQALLAGQTSTFANYTSYLRGLNGVIIDVASLANGPALAAADFVFRAGNTPDPATWSAAAAPTTILLRPGAGAGGSDRIEILWPDNTIQNQWLQVRLLADHTTNLAADDVFYFGNLIGDANGNGAVTVADIALAKSQSGQAAPIAAAADFNRSGQVTVADVAIAKAYSGNTLAALNAPAAAFSSIPIPPLASPSSRRKKLDILA
jgi:hypothetical protein